MACGVDFNPFKGGYILKRFFKYDYANKKRNICFFFMTPAVAFLLYLLGVSIAQQYAKGYIGVLIIAFYISIWALCAVAMSKKGILIDCQKRKVVIRDDRGKHQYSFDKIKGVSLVKVKKINKGKPFFLDAKEECEMWKYIYNRGEVYRIIFYIDSGDGGYYTYTSYFGWMYKEKSELKVATISQELKAFVHHLNALAKKQFNPN